MTASNFCSNTSPGLLLGIEPRVLADIDRMENAEKLSKYFDFPRCGVDQHASGNEYDTRLAQLALLAARYIKWFRGDNALPV
jgi:hypothetical protein